MSGSTQMMEIFSGKYRLQHFNHIGMVRPFCGFPMIYCYQDHGHLSTTNVLIAQSHSCIQGV